MSVRRLLRGPYVWITLAVVVVLTLVVVLPDREDPEELGFNEFLAHVENGEVDSLTDHARENRVEGELDDGTEFVAEYNPETDGERLGDALDEARVDGTVTERTVDNESGNTFVQILVNVLPFVIILGLFLFLMTQMQGGGGKLMSMGKSKAKAVSKDAPTVKFDDVAGADEAVQELVEIKEFLSNPAKFQAVGANIPKGVLLYGPPGTGKTLLARAVAGEAGAPFFSISGSDFVEMFVGVGASRVRDLFEQAKANAPAIIFMDEIDAVGRQRGAGMGGGHDEREQTLNQLLVEMDGFDAKTGVILIAATNRPDILDPALLRPGRFDRQVVVDRPDVTGRKAILGVHAAGKPLADDCDLDVLARRTPGFTGADLANLINEAALISARRDEEGISMATLEDAIDRVIGGPERRTRLMGEEEKRTIAYHEGGHTIVGHALPHADAVHKVSIIPRGQALGWTLSLPTEDKYLVARGELVDRLTMMLGGRVAEELTIGDYTTGAADDIAKATATAKDMVTRYGMSAALGPIALGGRHDQPFVGKEYGEGPDYSHEVAVEVDREVRALIDEAHDEALEILANNREILEELADALVEGETVEGQGLAGILGQVTPRPSRKIQPLMNGQGSRNSATSVIGRLRRLKAKPGDAGGITPSLSPVDPPGGQPGGQAGPSED